jgi:YebC/PmpR family DNA-binding regulatory protein
MAGHSHWAGIKHRKGAQDAKRGKIFSKHAKAIITAARLGGGDPDMNLRLKYAIEKAKADNMPKDNIDRAVKKGTGELEGDSFVELMYEGFYPGGVAVMIEALTDNRNRTAPEIRKIFEKRGGNMGESGSVSWMFEKKASFLVKGEKLDENSVMEKALEVGADDFQEEGDGFLILAEPQDFAAVKEGLENCDGIMLERSEITMIPKNMVALDLEKARQVINLMEELDDHEDVQNVYANFEIPEELMEQLGS